MSRIAALTLVVIVLGTALEWALHVHQVPGAWALAGAVGCALIVAVAKALGALALQRPERGDE